MFSHILVKSSHDISIFSTEISMFLDAPRVDVKKWEVEDDQIEFFIFFDIFEKITLTDFDFMKEIIHDGIYLCAFDSVRIYIEGEDFVGNGCCTDSLNAGACAHVEDMVTGFYGKIFSKM